MESYWVSSADQQLVVRWLCCAILCLADGQRIFSVSPSSFPVSFGGRFISSTPRVWSCPRWSTRNLDSEGSNINCRSAQGDSLRQRPFSLCTTPLHNGFVEFCDIIVSYNSLIVLHANLLKNYLYIRWRSTQISIAHPFRPAFLSTHHP